MSNTLFSAFNRSADPGLANQDLCADLSLLFSTLLSGLADVIARTGGKPLSDQFVQQINRYAEQHGWQVLTGLSNLYELGSRVPDVEARMLLSVYRSYARHAQLLAGQILGQLMLKSTMTTLLKRLPPKLAVINEQYGVIQLC
jgi:hypothetical protein